MAKKKAAKKPKRRSKEEPMEMNPPALRFSTHMMTAILVMRKSMAFLLKERGQAWKDWPVHDFVDELIVEFGEELPDA